MRKASEPQNVSPQSRSPFSASFQTFCLTARAYLNTQKYGLFVNWVIVKDNLPVTSFRGIWNREILETTLVSCHRAMCIHELVFRALGDPFRLPNWWRNFTYYKQEEYTNCILNDTVTFCSSHLYCRGTPSSCCISLQWGGSSHHLQALVNQKDYEISYNSDTYKTVSSDTLNNIQSAPSTQTVGSFDIDDGDVSENVTFKMN